MTKSNSGQFENLQRLVGSIAASRLLLFGAIAIFLTILGPFGTDGIRPAWSRGIYWFVMIYGGAGISFVTSVIWLKLFKQDQSQVVSLSTLGLVIVTAVPITAMVAGLGFAFSSVTASIDVLVLYFYVVTITAAVTLASVSINQSYALKSALSAAEEQARSVHAAHNNKAGDTPPEAFASRLRMDLRNGDLVSLSADDHYLDVITSIGREQIRCTLADAAGELAALDGRVIHRSHWVAKSAMVGLVKSGSQTLVRLEDGRDLPVSRTRLRNLQKENWLPPKSMPISGDPHDPD